MLNVPADYGRLSDSNAFVWTFSNIITCLKRYIFIKLSQIVLEGKSVGMKKILLSFIVTRIYFYAEIKIYEIC